MSLPCARPRGCLAFNARVVQTRDDLTHIIEHDPEAFEIPGFLSPDECAALVSWSESHGYEAAGFSGRSGTSRVQAVRNNDRIIDDDDERAEHLWRKLAPSLSEAWRVMDVMRRGAIGVYEVCGLNERFRWYRYGVEQRFREHVDKMFHRKDGAVSLATVLIYLNGDVVGGQTRVKLGSGAQIMVEPQAGSLLCFDHRLLHEGMPVERGSKYVLRTDLMYSLREGT